MHRTLRLVASCVLASLAFASRLTFAAPARASETGEPEADPNALRGPRVAFVPGLGVGMRQFVNGPSYFPSFVGVTTTQVEISVEGEKVGGFVRAAFLSSGSDGRWTAPVLALGGQYRLLGDGEVRPGLVLRAGLLYERWHANNAYGCFIPLFFPDNCKLLTPAPMSGVIQVVPPAYNVTVDTLGLLAGARFELPVSKVYLALGGELSSTVDVSSSVPGATFGAQITLSFAFRNHQDGNASDFRSTTPARYRERYK